MLQLLINAFISPAWFLPVLLRAGAGWGRVYEISHLQGYPKDPGVEALGFCPFPPALGPGPAAPPPEPRRRRCAAAEPRPGGAGRAVLQRRAEVSGARWGCAGTGRPLGGGHFTGLGLRRAERPGGSGGEGGAAVPAAGGRCGVPPVLGAVPGPRSHPGAEILTLGSLCSQFF